MLKLVGRGLRLYNLMKMVLRKKRLYRVARRRGPRRQVIRENIFKQILQYYQFLEVKVKDSDLLPNPPSLLEKYSYVKRGQKYLIFFSVISFTAVSIGSFEFIYRNPVIWPLFTLLMLTLVYFDISLIVNIGTRDFDLKKHLGLTKDWRLASRPDVDIFLPIAGEPIEVLSNTWTGIQRMTKHYRGNVKVYCLDDGDSQEAHKLAQQYGFTYIVRPDRGVYKKAGNLRHGFNISNNPFIAIFDADFVPRKDFLDELLPYFDSNPRIGIVQSPQYFSVSPKQNWLERGAGAVQELFYRYSQVSRQYRDASICVGSNAIYRRRALDDTGGTALIEHSEDVHTGFNIRMHGWTIQYVPVILAKGLCPSGMAAFFKQQYRWCLGSMSLMTSQKFWRTKLPLRTRMSYFSGFLYYISTAIASIYASAIPLLLLLVFPREIALQNYILILPAIIFAQIIYPIWHHSTYGIEAWATRTVYGWAHLFAIYDTFSKKHMEWQPTGSKVSKERRYTQFRIMQILCNFIPACLWVGVALWRDLTVNRVLFLPILCSGLYYLAVSLKVTMYRELPSLPASRETSQPLAHLSTSSVQLD